MAATNFTPIQLYFSTTASAVPTAANLAQGELAININDGKLYYEDSTGVVQVIATKGAGTIGGSTTQIQYNNAGALAGNAAMVFNSATSTTTLTTLNLTNALGAIYGGTAQSTYAQGDIVYASAANTLAKLGIGVVNYILTSTGSIPQWVAPSSIAVLTATNLAGGAAGSVPYQSGVATTTFLAIGAANRVMTSTGTAPQWVTALTGLTGVSSSSITDTGLTSGRVTFASTSGLLADSANLTFNGTTLTTAGLSNSGFSTLVKTLTLGDTSFNGTAVFAPTTPAKLYMGTGTVTDVTSAISATNTTGAIASLAITPIAATNTGVTYTNASTLYIAGAPSAGTNITITNPFALYVDAGAAYFGGAITAATTLGVTGAVTLSSTLGVTGVSTLTAGAVIQGLTVGKGASALATNTAVGVSALAAVTSGGENTAFGASALKLVTTGSTNTGIGTNALQALVGGTDNTALGSASLFGVTSGIQNVGIGRLAAYQTTTGNNNVAIGSSALSANITSGNSTAIGFQAGTLSTGIGNQFFGYNSGSAVTTGAKNVILGSYTGSAAPISLTGSNNIVLSDGDGVVRQVIDSSGNAGIGTTSPGVSGLEISRATGSAPPTPVELRLATTTSASNWSLTDPWARLSFYSGDVSDSGPKIHAAIDAISAASSGGLSALSFSTNIGGSNTLTERLVFAASEAVFNNPGADYDFRVESDTNTHALFVQGSDGNVGFGTSSPARRLDVTGVSGDERIAVLRAVGTDINAFLELTPTGTAVGLVNSTTTGLALGVAGSTKVTVLANGNVGIGTTAPNASAILDAQSTTKGVRMPNMTTTQKNAIASPAAGLMVFDTTLAKLAVYSGTAWQTITSV